MQSEIIAARESEVETSRMPITAALLDAALGQPLASLDVDEFENALDRAYELALFPLVYRFGCKSSHESHSAYKQGKHRQRWIRHRLRRAILRESLARVSNTLKGVDYVILKGSPLSERLYGGPDWRDSGDIDVLIRYKDMDEVIRRMEAVGFRPEPGHQPQPWVNNEYHLISNELGVVVELHWSLALPRVPSPSADKLLKARVWHAGEGGLQIPVLDRESGLLQACYHFHHHAGFLKGLFDIAGWLDRYEGSLDFAAIDALAGSLGVRGLVQWPLSVLAQVTNLDVPGRRDTIGAIVMGWSWFSRITLKGVLANSNRISGDHALAFKTQEILKGQVLLWSVSSMTLLDTPEARLKGILSPIFLGPDAMSAKLGKPTPDLETWARISLRPVELAIKQLREIGAR